MPEYNPPIAHYCHVDVSEFSDSSILKMIGKKGFLFKKITQDCNASYIWWNKENKVIEIWGPYNCMKLTKHNIIYHINHIHDENYRYRFQQL